MVCLRHLASLRSSLLGAVFLSACAPTIYVPLPNATPTPTPESTSAPSISSLSAQTTTEDTATGSVAFTITDADSTLSCGSSVSVTSSDPSVITSSGVSFSGTAPNCLAVFTPVANASGSSTVTLTVSDGSNTSSSSFILTVTPVNDAPTISTIVAQSTNEDTASGSIAFTISDVDNTLTCAGSVTGSSGTTSVVANSGIAITGTAPNCTVALTPVANANGTSTITLTVSDGSLSNTSSFVLTVTAVNDAPTITAFANQTINEDTSTTALAFTISDVDSTLNCSSSMSAASSNSSVVAVGGISFGGTAPSCTVTVTPVANANGTSTLTLTVTDGSLTATSAFLMTVNAVNDAPTISAISAQSTAEDTAKTGIAFTITDVDSTLTCAGSVTGSSGTTSVVANSGIAITGTAPNCTVALTPVANANGTSTITLTVSDGSLSNTSSFVLTVTAVNDAPTISAITTQTTSFDDAKGSIAFTISDVDNTLNCSTSVTATALNSATISFSGTAPNCFLLITPTAGSVGSFSQTIRVSDGTLNASTSFIFTVAPPIAPRFRAIAAGDLHTCGLTYDGLVYCWGDNTYGQLGTSDNRPSEMPVAIDASNLSGKGGFTKIFAGGNSTCGMTGLQETYCWGSNSKGQIAIASQVGSDVLSPTKIDTFGATTGETFTHLFMGASHSCGISNQSLVYCWGNNNRGQLGDHSNTTQAVPTLIDFDFSVTTFKTLALSRGTTCGITLTGETYCWGNNSKKELGNPSLSTSVSTPSLIDSSQMPTGEKFIELTSSELAFCGLTKSGVYCWGTGPMGRNATSNLEKPSLAVDTSNVFGDGTFYSLQGSAPSASHICALTNHQSLMSCWGKNDSGQFGNGSTSDDAIPSKGFDFSLTNAGMKVVQIARGKSHSCAIMSDGYTFCMGDDSVGQLGNGASGSKISAFYLDTRNIKPYYAPKSLALGQNHTCALLPNGQLRCWGRNYIGQLGAGSYTSYFATPQTFGTSDVGYFKSVATGIDTTCAISFKGDLACSGEGTYGQLGNGATTSRSTPDTVARGARGASEVFISVTIGVAHACGIGSTSRAVYCWGTNTEGQLGNTSITTLSSTPVLVNTSNLATGEFFTEIKAGIYFTCGLTSMGKLYCWGVDRNFSLGISGISGTVTIPTEIDASNLSGFGIGSFSVGKDHIAITTTRPQVAMAGSNHSGELGTTDNSSYDLLTPITLSQLTTDTFVTTLVAGGNRTCAIASDGYSYCTGDNSSSKGALGVGDVTDRNEFTGVDVNGGLYFDELFLGESVTCGRAHTGQIYCAGSNDYGQLGSGSTGSNSTSFSTPIDDGEFFR